MNDWKCLPYLSTPLSPSAETQCDTPHPPSHPHMLTVTQQPGIFSPSVSVLTKSLEIFIFGLIQMSLCNMSQSNHDVLNLFSDLFSDNNQNLSFFSEFIFNSHYMFRRSGPGHMLLHTVQKQKVQGRISLSLVKVKAKYIYI